jgi:uncharacterized membrane protein
MPIKCPSCGSQMPENSAFCPGCGRAMDVPKPALRAPASGRDNIFGALAYVTIIPAIVFLLVEPFKASRVIRFHPFKCIFIAIAPLAVGIALKLMFTVLLFVPFLGQLMALLIAMIVSIGCLILWIVLIVKALQGERFKVPFIGDLAEKQANLA